MLIASMLLLAMVTATSGQWFIEVALVLSGLGMGATAPAMIAALAASVDRADLGVAGAASQTMSQIGVVVGMQLLLTIQDATEDRLGVGSYALAYRVGAIAAVVALVTALMVRRTSHAPVDHGDLAVES
jgi:MFS family permease